MQRSMIKKHRLRRFDVERRDDMDLVKQCVMLEVDETSPRKTWWDFIKENMKVLASLEMMLRLETNEE